MQGDESHAFLIMLVHDGAHRAITRSWMDSFLMNLGAGLVLLPFYAEPFRRYHLIHHGHTNPGYSWISMAWGLARRSKDTGPLRTVLGMLSRPDFQHYSPSPD